MSSENQVLSTLYHFRERSGLAISIQKTSFFSCGLSPAETIKINSDTGLTHASLPVRYLGIPLCSKNLNLANCQTLFQRIKGRLSTWTTKSLSFAGRRQLLTSVISGITNFWTSSLVLPKRCIEQINTICSEFLWKGTWGLITMQWLPGRLLLFPKMKVV